jgi:hypothetical protein
VKVRRALTAACVAVAVPLLSACGSHATHHASGISGAGSSGAADANNNGNYVKAGPLTYQLQVSRELNQYLPMDSEYVTGLPKQDSKLNPNQLWFGVFLWAKNETSRTLTTSDNIDIVDTQGTMYHPVKLDPAVNPYVWRSESLPPGATEPNPNTTAGTGPTGGRLLLFKLNDSIYDNRPLTLQIRAPSGHKVWATISLDL